MINLLLLLFILVFVRQYFWIVQNNQLAWALTAAVSLLPWFLYLKFKPAEEEKTPPIFWLLVALPLFLFFLLRLPFPDISFDVLNYRLVQSERALKGAPFIAGDFAPVIFPLNPSPDLATGIARHFLGYRAGTILNYLVLVWLGLILNRFLRPFVTNNLARVLAILFILASEHILFQINTYMVDLLALPLLLEACRLTSKYSNSQHKERDLLVTALLLGAALALKLSNVTAVVPITLWLAFEFFSVHRLPNRRFLILIAAAVVLFFLPSLPHAIYIYRETGSPFFPLYNEFFKSPFWPKVNVGDGRWGPVGVVQTLTWPLLGVLHPERLSELGLYSGRLSVAVVVALICLFAPKVLRSMRGVAFVTLLGSLMWSGSSGYVRYALFFEVLGGILLLYLLACLWSWLAKPARVPVFALIVLVFGAQGLLGVSYAYKKEWSGRPTFFHHPGTYVREMRYLFHDHNLSKSLPADKKPLFWNVDTWIVSTVKSSGVEVLLRDDVPMIGLHNAEYFATAPSLQRLRQTLRANRDKRVFTLVPAEEIDNARENVKRAGLELVDPNPVQLPFYSQQRHLGMVLFSVTPIAKTPPKPATPVTTEATGSLPFEAFYAQLSTNNVPARMQREAKQQITVTVKNASDYVWPSLGQAQGRFFINVSNAWYDRENKVINNVDGRSHIPFDLWPGESCEVPLMITAPKTPGEYTLELDMVQEEVAFFQGKGSPVLRLKVVVE